MRLIALVLLLSACVSGSTEWEADRLIQAAPLPPVGPVEAASNLGLQDDGWYPVDAETVAVLAGDRSFDVLAGRLANHEAWVAADQALRNLWPVLRPHIAFFALDGQAQATAGDFINVDKQALDARLGLSLSLDVVQARARVLSTRQAALAEDQATEASRRASILRASELFDLLLRSQNEVGIAQEYLDGATGNLDFERSREDAGTGLRADRIRAEAQEAAANTALLEARARFRDASVSLAEALRVDPRVTLFAPEPAVEPIEFFPETVGVDDLVAEAEAARPERAAATLRVGAAETSLTAARLDPWIPRFFVGAGVGVLGPDVTRLANSDEISAGFSWDLSPVNFGRRNVSRDALARRKLELARLKEEIRAEVVRGVEATRLSRELIRSARRQVEAAQASLDVVRERRAAGSALVVEVLDAQRELAVARQHLLEAVLRHNHSQRRLFFTVGRS